MLNVTILYTSISNNISFASGLSVFCSMLTQSSEKLKTGVVHRLAHVLSPRPPLIVLLSSIPSSMKGCVRLYAFDVSTP